MVRPSLSSVVNQRANSQCGTWLDLSIVEHCDICGFRVGQELRMDSDRASSGDWDAASTKKQWSTRRSETKGRKRRYDD